MKKILVPFDFSEEAYNALDFAAELADMKNSEITLLNIVEHSYEYMNFPKIGDLQQSSEGNMNQLFAHKMMEKAKEDIKEIMNEHQYNHLNIRGYVESRMSLDAIISFIEENEFDLVIMGTKGASGLRELWMGSHTQRVVRNSKVPVLTINENHKNHKFDNIVYATDFNEPHPPLIKVIKTIHYIYGSKLYVTYVNTPNEFRSQHEIDESLKQEAPKFDIDSIAFKSYNDKSIERGISNFAKDVDADLIVLPTHGRKGLSHMIQGSIAESLVNHSQIPVLTAKLH